MPSPAAATPRVPAAPRWQFSRLPDLPAADLYAALAARQVVFAVEQRCAYLDADGLDLDAWHLLGWVGDDAARALAGYLRILAPGVRFAEPAIGRVLTAPAHRGTGLGRVLMREGLARAARLSPGSPIRISAQQRLEAFYAGLGFRAVSAPFDEDGIPHVEMLHPGAAPARATGCAEHESRPPGGCGGRS